MISRDQDPICDFRSLISALLLQAIEDAQGWNGVSWEGYIRSDAKSWLIDVGPYWLEVVGITVQPWLFRKWVERGCLPGGYGVECPRLGELEQFGGDVGNGLKKVVVSLQEGPGRTK